MRESKIESELKTQIALRGGESFKFVSPGLKGVTDQIVILPTIIPVSVYFKLYWVECKQLKKKPGRHQRAFHKRLEALNQEIIVLDHIDDIHTKIL